MVTVDGFNFGQSVIFIVEVIDLVGNVLEMGFSVIISIIDESVFIWLVGVFLIVFKFEFYILMLVWTIVNDDVVVIVYCVMQDGMEVVVVSKINILIIGFSVWIDYSFSVIVEDGVGNVSIVGFSTSVYIFDKSALEWMDGDVLVVSNLIDISLMFIWFQVIDDVSVMGYNVY